MLDPRPWTRMKRYCIRDYVDAPVFSWESGTEVRFVGWRDERCHFAVYEDRQGRRMDDIDPEHDVEILPIGW